MLEIDQMVADPGSGGAAKEEARGNSGVHEFSRVPVGGLRNEG